MITTNKEVKMSQQLTFIDEMILCDYCNETVGSEVLEFDIQYKDHKPFQKRACKKCQERAIEEATQFCLNGYRKEVGT